MKYLIPLFLFFVSCTSPQIVSPVDKDGNQIHSVLKEPFFGAPNQGSEWSFWYFILLMVALWLVWKEFKSVKFSKKQNN
jgi:hypothetical protein